jgi:hypothetical protein
MHMDFKLCSIGQEWMTASSTGYIGAYYVEPQWIIVNWLALAQVCNCVKDGRTFIGRWTDGTQHDFLDCCVWTSVVLDWTGSDGNRFLVDNRWLGWVCWVCIGRPKAYRKVLMEHFTIRWIGWMHIYELKQCWIGQDWMTLCSNRIGHDRSVLYWTSVDNRWLA